MTAKSGDVTKMLTRAGLSLVDHTPPTDAEVQEAKIRVKTGFSFIGITEHWHLSLCLFNRMFNQKCRAIQFANTHPTSGTTSSKYNISELRGWTDRFNGEVFDVAMKVFEA